MLSPGLSIAEQNPPQPVKPGAPAATAPTPRRAAVSARPKDPFIGVWKLSAEKSKYESGGAPRSFTRTYEDRGGGTIFMTTDVAVPEGSIRAYIVYRRDGKPYPEAAAGAEVDSHGRSEGDRSSDRGRLLHRGWQDVGDTKHDHDL